MANNVVNKTVNIFIESGEAQKALDALLKKETQLKQELEKATNPKVVERLKQELKALEEPIERAAKKVSGELSPSFRDVEKSVNSLGQRLKRMSAEDADFEPVLQQWRQGRAELDQQAQKVGVLKQAMNSFWKEAKTVAVGVVIGNTVQSMLETVMGYVTGMVTGSAKIADELADIEKTTGLTSNQVKELNKELSKIDTRTSSADLRQLAAEAGKLGNETVEDVKKFVEQADKIRVALGEDLGEDAIISIGKLSKIFKVEMLNIGSAINEVGANSEASERFSVDFLNRLSGTGPAVKLAADQLLGYSAALEINGQTAEVSGTALSTFFIEFVRDTEKFGKAAGFANGELEKLVAEKGTNEGFLIWLERLKKANPDMSQFLARMQELGIDGARGANVLLTLSNNIGLVREQQEIANGAIQSNASIMEEFNKKNNNAAAELDKLKKNFAGLFASDTVMEGGAAVVRMLNGFVNLLKSIPGFIRENRTAILSLITVYAAYAVTKARATQASIINRAATILETVQHKALAIVKGILTVATNAASAAKLLFTTRTGGATIAMRIYNAVIRANPLGLLVTALGAAVTALSFFTSKTEADTTAQRVHNDIMNDVQQQTAATKDEIQTLTAVITSSTASTEEKTRALDRLKNISQEYLGGLTLENITTQEGIGIIQNYIKSIDQLADAKARANLKAKLKERILEKDIALSGLEVDKAGAGESITGDGDLFGINIFGRTKDVVDKEISKEQQERQTLQNQLKVLEQGNNTMIERYRQGIASKKQQLTGLKKDSEEAKKLEREIANDQNSLFALTGLSGTPAGGGTTTTTTDSPASGKLEKLRKSLKALQEQREKAVDDKQIGSLNKQITDTENQIRKLEGGTTKLSKAQKDASKDTNALAEELKRLSRELVSNGLSEEDRAFQQLDDKYQDLRERAKGNKILLTEIERLYGQELMQITIKQAEKRLEEAKKQDEKYQKFLEERKKNLALLNPLTAGLEGTGLQLNQILGRDAAAKAELEASKRSAKEQHDFLVQELEKERKMIEANTTLTANEKANIIRKINKQIADEERNFVVTQFENAINFAKGAVDLYNLFGSIQTNKENAELARDKAANDKKKKNLDDRLKRGLISQSTYDREVSKMDAEREKKEKEIRTKQFKRDQKAAIANILISAAQGAIQLWAKPGFPANLPLLALLALQTGLQVAAVASKKPEFGRGGLLNGPSHADPSRGMPVTHPYTGQIQAYLEGGEGIGSKRTMRDRKRYNVSGTPSQIFSLLNGINGGVTWSSGAVLRPAWTTQRPMPMNFAAINQSLARMRPMYADGGTFGGKVLAQDTASGAATGTEMVKVIQDMNLTLSALNATLASLQAFGINANVLLGSLEEAQARKKAIEDAGTMRV